MQASEHSENGILPLVKGIYAYLQEIDHYRSVCERHAATAAIHTKGEALQVYRLFARDADAARTLHQVTKSLPSWEESCFWKGDGQCWKKLQRDVESRMQKHSEQHPIVTKGIAWRSMPVLIHAYKFEPDPMMKVELMVPKISLRSNELPIARLANVLECHEYLLPSYSAKALPLYHRHDVNFLTLGEYLSRTMPPSLYASSCFPPQNAPTHA